MSKLVAIAKCKCPKCRTGDVFKHTLLQKPSQPLAVHEYCPTCGQKYEIEPGFWWAALYISYAINVAIMAITLIILHFLTSASTPLEYIVPVVVAMLVFYPYTMRYARILLLHFFASIEYDEHFATSTTKH